MPITIKPAVLKYKGTGGTFENINSLMGVGIPTGGTTGQVLTKLNGDDYATAWTSVEPTTLAIDNMTQDLYGGRSILEASLFSTATWQTGGVQAAVGSAINFSTSSSYRYTVFDVSEDDISFTITTYQSTSQYYPYYIHFTNSENVVIKAVGEIQTSAQLITYTDVSVPEGAAKIYITFNGTQPAQSTSLVINKKYYGSRSDGLIDRFEVVEDKVNNIDSFFVKKGYNTSQYMDGQKDASRVEVFGHNFSQKCLNFAFITDTHFGGTRYPEYDARNNMRAFVEMANERWVDFAVHGGDIITDYGLSRNDALKWMDDTLGIFGDIQVPLFITKGNHEVNNAYYAEVSDTSNLDWANTNYYVRSGISFAQTTSSAWDGEATLYVENSAPERIPDIQFTMLAQLGFAKDVERNSVEPMGGYFYKDFDYEKIRVIVLNEYQVISGAWSGVAAAQLSWLGNTALNLTGKPDYSVIIIGHSPNMVKTSQGTTTVGSILTAFKNGSTYDTYDFSGQGAHDIIMYLHGHEHLDTVDTSLGFNNIGVISGFVPAATVGTEDEIRFSIFSIDTVAKKIYETRVGTGTSREFTY